MRYDEIDDDTADQTVSANEDYESSVAIATTKYMEVMEGWFLAPATGNFKFYMSCDDTCRLEFDATNYYYSGGSVSYTTLIDVTSAMTYRNYMEKPGFYTSLIKRSASVSLTAGRYYKIRTQHRQNGGDAHMTLALEAEGAFTSGHPNA